MKRILPYLSAALVFFAAAFALTQPARTVKAADINERCSECLARTVSHYEQCQAQFGFDARCDEQFNRDTVNCYRQFCEQ